MSCFWENQQVVFEPHVRNTCVLPIWGIQQYNCQHRSPPQISYFVTQIFSLLRWNLLADTPRLYSSICSQLDLTRCHKVSAAIHIPCAACRCTSAGWEIWYTQQQYGEFCIYLSSIFFPFSSVFIFLSLHFSVYFLCFWPTAVEVNGVWRIPSLLDPKHQGAPFCLQGDQV